MVKASEDGSGRAFELVGRFLYHFSRLEEQINQALATLFKLEDGPAEIINANLDFTRKVNIIRSAVTAQNSSPNETWLQKDISDTFSAILDINTKRQVVAHSAFEAENGGVRFKRAVAKKELKREELFYDEVTFNNFFQQMLGLEKHLANVLRHIESYTPSFDFSDPRNSGYLSLV